MDYAVEVENLSKRYVIGEKERYLVLSEFLVKLAKAPFNLLRGRGFRKKNQFMALNDLNFKIKKGEVVGIIGRNGAGKSTLLKVLSRITEPTSGIVKMRGRVSSLLEVGTGFHPELTGRENIYLNGAILGMSKKEIDRKFDEIVEFSGVEKFLDMPVKRYSSGMQVRLAFSVAAHLEPDILIIDEVLAVGDAEFQKKCLGKMDEVTKDGGRTVIFVSHDMGAIKRICNKVLLMDNGRASFYGETNKAINLYLDNSDSISSYTSDNDNKSDAKIVKVLVKNSKNQVCSSIHANESFSIDLEYYVNKENLLIHSAIILTNYNGQKVFVSESSEKDMSEFKPKSIGVYRKTFKFPSSFGTYISAGDYLVRVSVGTPARKPIDSVENLKLKVFFPDDVDMVEVMGRDTLVDVNAEWS